MIQTIVFDFGNVVGFFDHNQTLDKLTPYTDLTVREMYASVYGSELEDRIESGAPLNWNADGVRLLERNWYAYSWKVNPNLRLAQMIAAHLKGLRCTSRSA